MWGALALGQGRPTVSHIDVGVGSSSEEELRRSEYGSVEENVPYFDGTIAAVSATGGLDEEEQVRST